MSHQIVYSLAYQTKDAVARDEAKSELTFAVGAESQRYKPNKLMLGSMEFPIVQYSIEEGGWDRVYFCERIEITPSLRSLTLQETAMGETRTARAVLPLHLNPIVEWQHDSGGLRVRFAHPHALWNDDGEPIAGAVAAYGGAVSLLCTPLGTLRLAEGDATPDGDDAIRVDARVAGEPVRAEQPFGFLHVAGPPSPEALCDALSRALADRTLRSRYVVVYDAFENKATLQTEQFAGDGDRFRLAVTAGDSLVSLLGYAIGQSERIFHRPALDPSSIGTGLRDAQLDVRGRLLLQQTQNIDVKASGDTAPYRLPPAQFRAWTHATLRPGWYTPTHRPMATGAPIRITQEWDMQFNRFFFPPTKDGQPPSLVFVDPSGRTQARALTPGRYTPDSIAAHLEQMMNRAVASSVPAVGFVVAFDACEGTFSFSCEMRDERTGRATPAPFSLLFAHPASLDPTRFGFGEVNYESHARYVSDHAIQTPTLEWPRAACDADAQARRSPTNLYQISEHTARKTLRINAMSPPPMVLLVVDFDPIRCELLVLTYMGGVRFAHGLRPGAIVDLTPLGRKMELLVEGSVQEMDPAALERRLAAVVSPEGLFDVEAAMPEAASLLRLRVPRVEWTRAKKQVLGLHIPVEPSNFCFSDGLPKSIGGQRLGFAPKAVQWGIDGTNRCGDGLRCPPFDATAVHALDHPDYVLLYLLEGKRSSLLQHQDRNSVTAPFAKIILYPLFREERMVPREVNLTSGEGMTRFTLAFKNPDGTAYRFHNAEFSFTLNFIS